MRVFTVSGQNMTIAGATTLVFINPPAAPSVGVRVLRLWAQQAGNATSAQTRIQAVTQVTAFPTLTSATPAKHMRHDPNVAVITGGTAGAAGTAGINASAEGAGAKTVITEWTFNNLNGFEWLPTKDESIELAAGMASGLGLYLPAAPGILTGWAASISYTEF